MVQSPVLKKPTQAAIPLSNQAKPPAPSPNDKQNLHKRSASLTTSQLHEREMAELAFKRQKLQLEAAQIELRKIEVTVAAQAEEKKKAQRHELLLKVMELGFSEAEESLFMCASSVAQGDSTRPGTGSRAE